jgi:hypothetical protein
MMAEFMREIYELLQDETSVKCNPVKACDCLGMNPSFKSKGKSNQTFVCYFVLMLFHFLVISVTLYPVIRQQG